MSGKPLSRKQQDEWISECTPHSPIRDWYATVLAAEARGERLREFIEELNCECDVDEYGGASMCPRCAVLAADGAS